MHERARSGLLDASGRGFESMRGSAIPTMPANFATAPASAASAASAAAAPPPPPTARLANIVLPFVRLGKLDRPGAHVLVVHLSQRTHPLERVQEARKAVALAARRG